MLQAMPDPEIGPERQLPEPLRPAVQDVLKQVQLKTRQRATRILAAVRDVLQRFQQHPLGH